MTRLKAFDWLLVVGIVGLFLAVAFFVLPSPAYWGRCLRILDVRSLAGLLPPPPANWSSSVWTGIAMALLVSLISIRLGLGQPKGTGTFFALKDGRTSQSPACERLRPCLALACP